MATTPIQFIFGQIDHWFKTPQNSYLGSNYGVDLYQYLHKPMTSQFANDIIAKMRQDIPVLQGVDDADLSIYAQDESFDTKVIHVVVKGMAMAFDLSNIQQDGNGQ